MQSTRRAVRTVKD